MKGNKILKIIPLVSSALYVIASALIAISAFTFIIHIKLVAETRVPSSIRPHYNLVKTANNRTPDAKIDRKNSSTSKRLPIRFERFEGSSLLVVGGSDGSGTRGIVQILSELGVRMASEDAETHDLHARKINGWPYLVSPILQLCRKSLDYEPEALPTLLNRTIAALKYIVADATSYTLVPHSNSGRILPIPNGVSCPQISLGFKAPVIMTLVPFIAKAFPRVKFLHVVRDGRDIAFSVNQAPVEKFYLDFFGLDGAGLPHPAKAIKLWSTWNTGIATWSERKLFNISHSSSTSSSKQKTKFEYLRVRVEDIIHTSHIHRFKEISRIASWVGSNATVDFLCCMSQSPPQLLSSHDHQQEQQSISSSLNTNELLRGHFGKWKTVLLENTKLRNLIYSEGYQGLQTFGYMSEAGTADTASEPTPCRAIETSTCDRIYRNAISETTATAFASFRTSRS